jgi:heat-inducible transcriptional repressor
MLDIRKQRVLKAIVEDYVKTAEPVGSKSLIGRHQLNVSSATIRNEMAELEELGYLEKPHTSAGRVPSDKGYRSYVDNLIEIVDLEPKQAIAIQSCFDDHLLEVSDLIRCAATALSNQTDFISLVLTPRFAESALRQIKMLMIEPGKALIVIVLAAGLVKDRLARVPDSLDAASLDRLAGAIEAHLAGRKLSEITLVAVNEAMENSSGIPEAILNQVGYEAYVAIKQAEHFDVYIEGTHKLLAQPEYRDIDKAHRFLSALNRDKVVAGYVSDLYAGHEQNTSRYLVRIGQEIALEGFEDTSFVTSSYCVDGEIFGQIAVIGPRRMDYGRIISQISFVNKTLTREAAERTGIGELESSGRDKEMKK